MQPSKPARVPANTPAIEPMRAMRQAKAASPTFPPGPVFVITAASSGKTTKISETSNTNYTLSESSATSAGSWNLTENGIDTIATVETGDSLNGAYTQTQTGTDAYTITESGTVTAGAFSLTLTGSDTVSQLETGNTINATFARTTTGGGSYTRTETGGTLGNATSTNAYTLTESGNNNTGDYSQLETGTDRFGLIEQFDNGNFAAKPIVNTGHFQTDDAAANHQQFLRHVFQHQRTGRIHHARIVPGEAGQLHRLRSGCDYTFLKIYQFLAVLRFDFDLIRRNELSYALHDRDLALFAHAGESAGPDRCACQLPQGGRDTVRRSAPVGTARTRTRAPTPGTLGFQRIRA